VQSVKEYELVVVVNDASTDKTRQLAEDTGTELAFFSLLNNFTYSQICVPISRRHDNPRFLFLLGANIKIFKALIATIKASRNSSFYTNLKIMENDEK
jgi:hypothetical protein